jgi:hypothetical protein
LLGEAATLRGVRFDAHDRRVRLNASSSLDATEAERSVGPAIVVLTPCLVIPELSIRFFGNNS